MRVEEIRHRDQLIEHLAKGNRVKYVKFWGHSRKHGYEVTKTCLSQWYPSNFEVDGVNYQTAEHFMMAEKARLFENKTIAQKIIAASSPAKAKQYGREVLGFDESVWRKYRFDIVVKGNIAKFKQNSVLKEFLLSTGKKVLVEASPVDKIWGIGLTEDHEHSEVPTKWKGLNLLGFALMAARKQIKLEE